MKNDELVPMYHIVTVDNKVRWYWTGKGLWTSFRPNAKRYATQGIAQSALTRMSVFNKADAYIEPVKPNPQRITK